MMEGAWRDIFTWQSILALVLGVLLKLSAQAVSQSLVAALLGEVGTALMVAVFVWAFFEVASRRQQEVRLDSRIERITRNVFFGVFRRDLPEGLINEASILVLEASIVRKDFVVTYTLSDDTYSFNGREVPCVRVRAVAEFSLKNISLDNCTVAVGVALPNPIQPGMREKSDVNSVRIRRDEQSAEETLDLVEAKGRMREEMGDDRNLVARCTMNYILQPDQEIRVYADYVMAKEIEDTEVLQSCSRATAFA